MCLINDQLIAQEIPLLHQGGALAVTSWNSKVAFDNISVKEPGSPVPIVEAQPPVVVEQPPAETIETVNVEAPVGQPAEPVVEAPVVVDEVPVVVEEEVPQVISAPITAEGILPYFEDFTDDANHNFNILSGEWELRNNQLVQTNPRVADVAAVIPSITLGTDQPYNFSTNLDVLDGPHGGGLMFNMQRPESIAESHMVRLGSNADGGKYLIYGFFDAEQRFNWQGDTQPLPFDRQAKLGVDVQGNSFNLLMDDQVLAENIPLVYQGGRAGVTTWNSTIAFDNLSLFDPTTNQVPVVEVPQETISESLESALPWFEDFTGDEDHAFIDVGGNWQLREETMLQLNPDVFDVLAILPGLTISPEESYDFTTDLKVLEGPKGGGIAFNVQNIDSIRESHMVRFGSNDGNDYLIYGYFDENRSFNVQGSVVPDIESEANLGVSISGTSYDVLVNEEVVARDIPLIYLGGRAALSTWNSSIGFDNIAVTSPFGSEVGAGEEVGDEAAGESDAPAEEAPIEEAPVEIPVEEAQADPPPSVDEAEPEEESTGEVEAEAAADSESDIEAEASAEPVAEEPSETDGGAEEIAPPAEATEPTTTPLFFAAELNEGTDQASWTQLSGTWSFTDTGLTHAAEQEGENAIVYENNYDQFQLNATLSMGGGSGSSGVIFNAPTPDSIAGAHVVRYQSNEVVSWGYFAEDGTYVEQGITIVPPAGSGEHTFSVQSDGASYAISLDGETLAQGQDLLSAQGKVGFTADGREVTITSIEISPLAEETQ